MLAFVNRCDDNNRTRHSFAYQKGGGDSRARLHVTLSNVSEKLPKRIVSNKRLITNKAKARRHGPKLLFQTIKKTYSRGRRSTGLIMVGAINR